MDIFSDFQKKMLKEFGNNKICVNSTHGTNAYNFQLITLLVVDEYGCGCPVAFCFSNRIDVTAINIFFNSVKQKVGIISTDVFMSDDAAALYNAWEIVMGPPKHRLLCTWHIDQNWRRNLCKIKGSKMKKMMVYKTLKVLQQETDKKKFEILETQFIEQLKCDEETKQFCDYYCNFYAPRIQMWAFCFRMQMGINTNMYLEAMHKVLKHCYLEGKKIKRLDETISAFMKLIRDKFFERIIKLTKSETSTKLAKIKQNHLRSLSIPDADVSPIENIENAWLVKSAHKKIFYTVLRSETQICEFKR